MEILTQLQMVLRRGYAVLRGYPVPPDPLWMQERLPAATFAPIWRHLEQQPREVAALLRVLHHLPPTRTGTTAPASGWWESWQQAIAAVDAATVRTLCEQLWTLPDQLVAWWHTPAYNLARAALWGVVPVATDETCERLAQTVEMCLRAERITHAIIAIRALERIGTPAAYTRLESLPPRIRHKTARRALDQVLAAHAARLGTDTETLQDRNVAQYGLDATGRRAWAVGAYQAVVRLTAAGAVETQFINPAGRPVQALPKDVQSAAAPVPAEVRATAKQLRAGYSTQKARLEEALVNGRSWTLSGWQETLGAHPILRNLAQRLVWEIRDGETVTRARPDAAGGWMAVDDAPITPGPEARLALLHPVTLPGEALQPWQAHIIRHQVVQPFKQIFRETYVVTPPEEQTATYSNRFAAQVVGHRMLYALLRGRGWAGMAYFGDGDDSAGRRDYPAAGYRVWIEASDATGSVFDDNGLVTLDRVWFARLTPAAARRQPVDLRTVPPVVFSEAMRDVDLFVGVAGRGRDPNWIDWETRQVWEAEADTLWATYERMNTATAEQRAAVLRELLPLLGLGERAVLKGRFVLVRGQRHQYRVHLGSGNIHIEPTGRYLCIVPARRQVQAVYVPFEENDLKTAEIVSKILLLAADDQIKDPAILRQL